MAEAAPEPSLTALLLRAGYRLPAATVAEVGRGHALLLVALARVGQPPPDAEPATVFRPSAAP